VAEERDNLLLPGLTRWPAGRPIIELEDVRKAYGDKEILRGLTLTCDTGQTTTVMGQSGSGKSVLLRIVNGLERADSGSVKVFGIEMAKATTRELTLIRKRIGVLFQNYALMDSLTVRDNIAFPLEQNAKLSTKETDRRIRELLELLGLGHTWDMLPSELSGGMKKRVSLARALIPNPELVLFDEPTTGLDPVMIEFVDGLITRAQERFNITSLIISHDVGSVQRLSDKVGMLYDGQIIQTGTFEQIQASTNEWVRSFVNVGGSGRMEGDDDDDDDDAICDDIPRRLAMEKEEPVVRIKGLHKSFGSNHVLKGVDLVIPPRAITVIIGGSGSGKSVIIKHIIGLFLPDSGDVSVLGQDMVRARRAELKKVRGKFGMLFQHAALFDSMTVRENVAFPLVERGLASGDELKRRVDEVLEQLHIPDLAHRMPAEISNGQAKRVALARAMITRPSVMIYDEPTTGQDPVMIRNVDNMIEEAQRTFDITSIVISHDMVSTFRIADRVALLHMGEILAYGTPAEVRRSRNERVREFIFAGGG
jgi:ABC-type transporter Mla maintaining outer membrane lipid asymmetry ATPase subunit MlaF